jgi:TolB-like protein
VGMAELRVALEQISMKPADQQPSIAVLPFANMSSDKEQEYFSDGLAEEILNLLAKIPALKVIARTSSFAFRGKDQDIRKIAEALGVAHVLEGSVRRADNRIRVTAQLIAASEVAGALRVRLSGAPLRRHQPDLAALRSVPPGAPPDGKTESRGI